MDSLTDGVRAQSSDLIEYVSSGREFPVGSRVFRVGRLRRGHPSAISTPEVFVQIRRLPGNVYTLGLYDDRPVPGLGHGPLVCAYWLERVR